MPTSVGYGAAEGGRTVLNAMPASSTTVIHMLDSFAALAAKSVQS
ncbi:MAG TPA: hypothetical protein VGC14_11840 [Rhizobium sp.]